MSRREFVNLSVGAIGTIIVVSVGVPAVAYVLGPGLNVNKTEAWIPLGKIEQFEVRKPTLVSFTRTTINGWERTTNSYGVYVTRKENDEITVFSNVCTHLGCRVTWKEDEKIYFCPCHDGIFDELGQIVDGPPPKPMIAYETKIEEGNLFMKL
jgi:Rieske Fe-S protein